MERGVVWLGISNWEVFQCVQKALRSNQLRRVLKAAGYRMRKSRAPISSDNLGGYMIVDMSGNAVAAGGRFELTLEEVREWVRDMC